jgi:hypothetical protein
VNEVVPKNTFIDKRDFPNYADLYKYIKGMSQKEYENYLGAIDIFLRSPAVHPYSSEGYVDDFLKTQL